MEGVPFRTGPSTERRVDAGPGPNVITESGVILRRLEKNVASKFLNGAAAFLRKG